MTHQLILHASATLDDRAPGRAIWNVGETPPAVLCGGLALLKERLVDTLLLRPARGDWVVRLGRADAAREIRMSRSAPRRLEILLGETELERWFFFFLRYFRDRRAEVDHLDIEGESDATGERFDLALRVPHASPPVGDREARNLLGRR